MVLYEHAMESKVRDMKFSAILHGADPKDLEDKELPSVTKKDNLVFGDPTEYEKLSEEEKKKLSDEMRSKFFAWAGAKEDG